MSLIRLTSPNIKVRRLGYFVLLTKKLREYRSLPEPSLIREFEKVSVESIDFFKSYPYKSKNETPIKPTKKHDGAKRYIRTAEELGLVVKLANEYHITKFGDVAASLPGEKNPFVLSLSQRCFFLKLLLKKDRDVLIPIIKMIEDKLNISSRLKFFREYIAKKGGNLRWVKNPKKYYYESIESPRIGWLKDLKVISSNVELDKKYLPFFTDDFFKKDPDLTNIYYQEFSKANEELKNVRRFDDLSLEEKRDWLNKYLNECYELFKLLGVWRISASQFLEYTTCVMLCRDRVLSSFLSLEKALVDSFDYDLFPFKLRRISGKEDIGFIVRIP